MRTSSRRKVAWVLLALLALTAMTVSVAFAENPGEAFTIGNVQMVVFAPSTVWQGTNAHVVIKATNIGNAPSPGLKIKLTLPAEAKSFSLQKTFTDTLSVKELKAGETKYVSFTYINPKTSLAVGDYKGKVTVSLADPSVTLVAAEKKEVTVNWPVSLREGTRYQASTGMIVVLILAVSIAVLVGWFIYFKVRVNPAFVFFKSVPEAIIAIIVILLFFGANLAMALQ